jgi:hypothetical protein
MRPVGAFRLRGWCITLALILLSAACDSALTVTPYPTPAPGPTATANLRVSVSISDSAPVVTPYPTPAPGPTATANIRVSVSISGPTPTFTPPPSDGAEGLLATLDAFTDTARLDSAKADALATLRSFTDPGGLYHSAWWLANDGHADIYEILAVILYTEGNTNVEVTKAIAGRYLWYCGGAGLRCSGTPLVNFLAYFQPWRQPWLNHSGFISDHAQDWLWLARDMVAQTGLVTDWIPGADKFVHDPQGLYGTSVYWDNVVFHFANVDPSWDTYLRERLHRGPNGASGLWVLTIREAGQVCQSRFICEDMTQPKTP